MSEVMIAVNRYTMTLIDKAQEKLRLELGFNPGDEPAEIINKALERWLKCQDRNHQKDI